ncbi:MAG: peptidase M28, partial [Arenibacter sp.]|nr:peptidase M28 [Arenibacter sp.]
MRITLNLLLGFLFILANTGFAQESDEIEKQIVVEANENSQLEKLAHELMDVVGPRLVGTPQMKAANDWAIATYNKWGIAAKSEQWGTWKGWERGITHIDLVSPRVVTLQGMQLAWSPSTPKKGTTAKTVIIPNVPDSIAFINWLPSVKGKFVLVSMNQPTGRPDYNWEEFATEPSFKKMKRDREEQVSA